MILLWGLVRGEEGSLIRIINEGGGGGEPMGEDPTLPRRSAVRYPISGAEAHAEVNAFSQLI